MQLPGWVASTVDPYLAVAITGLLPGVEPRYAYLLGLALGLDPLESLLVSVASTMLLAFILTVFVSIVDPLLVFACERRPARWNLACMYARIRAWSGRRGARLVERYGPLGVFLLVAVPLPATGMYTGALAAALLGLRGLRLLASLALGGLASLAIVYLTSTGAAEAVSRL